MADPYSDLNAAPADIQTRIADAMEARCTDPVQIDMRRRYLSRLALPDDAFAVEFGSGTGHVTRDLIEMAGAARALGIEPSEIMVTRAQDRHGGVGGLTFAVGDAADTGLSNDSADLVVMHTLLCHVTDLAGILDEAGRILRPGGLLAILDGDYDPSSVALSSHDPMQAVIDRMTAENVRNLWLPRRLPGILAERGYVIQSSEVFGYSAATDPTYMLTVLDRGADTLLADGVIGPDLAEAIRAESRRRVDQGSFFGSMNYICLIAAKPRT